VDAELVRDERRPDEPVRRVDFSAEPRGDDLLAERVGGDLGLGSESDRRDCFPDDIRVAVLAPELVRESVGVERP
jgi:hypothetical protein